jgi:hypothetical protein
MSTPMAMVSIPLKKGSQPVLIADKFEEKKHYFTMQKAYLVFIDRRYLKILRS